MKNGLNGKELRVGGSLKGQLQCCELETLSAWTMADEEEEMALKLVSKRNFGDREDRNLKLVKNDLGFRWLRAREQKARRIKCGYQENCWGKW